MSEITGNHARRVEIAGHDITNWVLTLPRTPATKPAWGEIVENNQLSITCRSDDGFMVPLNEVSLFYNKRIDEMTLKVFENDILKWSGSVVDVRADLASKRVTVQGDSYLSKRITSNALANTDPQNPAEAVRLLLAQADIDADPDSLSAAASVLEDVPMRLRITLDHLQWAGSLGDILRAICAASIGRMYLTERGTIGYDTWSPVGNPTITFDVTDDLLLRWPVLEDENMDPQDGWKVDFLHGVDEQPGTNIKQLDFTANSPVQLTTQTGAFYCGSQWVALSLRKYLRVTIHLDRNYILYLHLGRYLSVNSTRMGLFDTFGEVIGIDDGDERWVAVTLQIDKENLRV